MYPYVSFFDEDSYDNKLIQTGGLNNENNQT